MSNNNLKQVVTYEDYFNQNNTVNISVNNGSYGFGGNSSVSISCVGGGGGAGGSVGYASSRSIIPSNITEHPHDKVVRILKGDFEKFFGMSFDKFTELYNEILENYPEKLI